ncbi:MAG: rhamnulokinase [Streptosporangiaceae bacterium]
MTGVVAAVDLGASSGRVNIGVAGRDCLDVRPVHRFPNVPVTEGRSLRWDLPCLHGEVLSGLRKAAAAAGDRLASVGIDSWGVDFGLLDAGGALLGNPVHYRDGRTDGVAARVTRRVPAPELYAVTGIQSLPINTIFQLAAAAGTPELAAADTLLLMPDLLGYLLTGEKGAEVTNASTTALLDVRSGTWATALMERLEIPPRLFPPLRRPGEVIGVIGPRAGGGAGPLAGAAAAALAGTLVVAVGSHDTASAVAGVPAASPAFAYISCGTWSLVGVELTAPVLTEASRAANFTNETGIDGTVRYLRNVMGLWLLQESLRTWSDGDTGVDLAGLLDAAARERPLRSVIDPDDPAFLAPGDMPARIAWACRRGGQPVPVSPGEHARCILDSLALAYRRAIRQAQDLSGQHADVVHIVGGGSRNALLCQLTADACGLPVVAGPAEAATIGNILVQARALGTGPADLAAMRGLIASSQPLRHYAASGSRQAWQEAESRVDAAKPAST